MPSSTAPAGVAGNAVVEFNNMVTPYTNRLFNALHDRGTALSVVSCTRKEANRDWGGVAARYPHMTLPGFAVAVGPRRFAHVNLGIWRTLSRLDPGVLIVNGLYPSMVAAALWARWKRVPLILRADGGANDMPRTPYHALVRPRLLAQCRAVVVCGRKGRDYFAGQGVPRNRIVEMPIVPAWDAPAQSPGYDERPFDLLWAAELDDAVKNLSFFRDVVLAIHRRMPGVRVRILGRGADSGLLDALRADGVDLFHEERRDWQDMPDVFLSSRLMLLPSHREPWGLVCNEAMQCGTVCMVSPNVGAADDLVTAANGVVAPLDVDAWATRALTLLRDAAIWSDLSTAARAAAAARTVEGAAGDFESAIALARRR